MTSLHDPLKPHSDPQIAISGGTQLGTGCTARGESQGWLGFLAFLGLCAVACCKRSINQGIRVSPLLPEF
jgi:hypothetical protein